jgi:hypothetical protein
MTGGGPLVPIQNRVRKKVIETAILNYKGTKNQNITPEMVPQIVHLLRKMFKMLYV